MGSAPTVVVFLRVPVELRDELQRVAVRRFKTHGLTNKRTPTMQSEGTRLLAAAVKAELASPEVEDQLDLFNRKTALVGVLGEAAVPAPCASCARRASRGLEGQCPSCAAERVRAELTPDERRRIAERDAVLFGDVVATKPKPLTLDDEPDDAPSIRSLIGGLQVERCGKDGCIHELAHEGVHSNGYRTWSDRKPKEQRNVTKPKNATKVPRSCPSTDLKTGESCGRPAGHDGLHADGARRWRTPTRKATTTTKRRRVA